MFSRKLDGPLTVQVPSPAQDRPAWRVVGMIGAVGFVVGIAWPRLAGVRLGPNLPADTVPAASTSASAVSVASQAPGASLAPSSLPSAAARVAASAVASAFP